MTEKRTEQNIIMPRKSQPIRWTIDRASVEFGIANQTLDKRIRQADIKPGEDGCYSTRQIAIAIFSDEKAESTRLKKEQADKTALQNEIIRGERPTIDGIYKAHESIFIALRQTILASHLTDAEKSECLKELQYNIAQSGSAG